MRRFTSALIAICLVSAGCSATRDAALMSQWQPVHQFPAQPTPIYMAHSIEYRVTPVDSTLRLLLSRWAYLSGVRSEYQLSQDWTLHSAAAAVNGSNLESAAASLSRAYAERSIEVVVVNQVLIARPVVVSK